MIPSLPLRVLTLGLSTRGSDRIKHEIENRSSPMIPSLPLRVLTRAFDAR